MVWTECRMVMTDYRMVLTDYRMVLSVSQTKDMVRREAQNINPTLNPYSMDPEDRRLLIKYGPMLISVLTLKLLTLFT